MRFVSSACIIASLIIFAFYSYNKAKNDKINQTIKTMDQLSSNWEVWGKSGKTDAWGNKMRYRFIYPWNIVLFSSAGPDSKFGTEDDILKNYLIPEPFKPGD